MTVRVYNTESERVYHMVDDLVRRSKRGKWRRSYRRAVGLKRKLEGVVAALSGVTFALSSVHVTPAVITEAQMRSAVARMRDMARVPKPEGVRMWNMDLPKPRGYRTAVRRLVRKHECSGPCEECRAAARALIELTKPAAADGGSSIAAWM